MNQEVSRWPPPGKRLLSGFLVVSPLLALAGLILANADLVSWLVAILLQIPLGASIVLLLRSGGGERTGEGDG